MSQPIQDQSILITGAGRGLGRAAALHLAGLGAVIGVCEIDPAACDATVKAARDAGGKAFGYPGTAVYTLVKTGLVGLTKVLAAELGPRNIRVNAVSPGSVPTPGALGLNDPKVYEERKRTIPLRRLGAEQDNSQAIAFLLSPEASFINGDILNVDGGVAAAG